MKKSRNVIVKSRNEKNAIILSKLDISKPDEVFAWGKLKHAGVSLHQHLAARCGLRDVIAEKYNLKDALNYIDTPGYIQCFIKKGNHSLGIVEYMHGKSEVDGGKMLYLNMIYIRPADRGKGVGTKVLFQLQKLSRQKGERLELECWYENPAKSLYERMGFKPIKTRLFL